MINDYTIINTKKICPIHFLSHRVVTDAEAETESKGAL